MREQPSYVAVWLNYPVFKFAGLLAALNAIHVLEESFAIAGWYRLHEGGVISDASGAHFDPVVLEALTRIDRQSAAESPAD